ncbi:DNA repair protein rad18 [Paracoccidioides brasiliensis]|uniref:Postreplication repair E3 ubiquitin-protein ligase RAD18 n=1 Tax=Paracoccidioides brasiliensis TaxID=121759 RepID=A0A1D2JKW9_PARBR|nr:DNA repair protein rad18 [Paracoccidioides brasiliensis]ODH48037.1 DNA repair protein rad18 [Paracoccidioides brasiliensis]
MDHGCDIPDSTDWLSTPIPKLARVESALRCQVCKDFFDNPVITSCSHTFCSLCIRRCLSTEGKCPACRSGDQELKLRRNWAMQEMVDSFKLARPSVLEFARSATVRRDQGGEEEDGVEMPMAKRRKIETATTTTSLGLEKGKAAMGADGRRTRSQSKRTEDRAQQVQVEVIEDTEDEDFEPDDGLVACPICSRRMKNEAVFTHLDTCTGSPASPKTSSSFGPLRTPALPPQQSVPAHNLKRLPTINYSLLKETVLRRKLKELGIPEWGPKPLLQKRHTEWMNIWNANCDSRVPKPKRELLRELDIWERTQGGQAPTVSSLATSHSVMRKDFDASAWSTTHADDYKTLIASARMKKAQIAHVTLRKPPSPDNETADSNEDHTSDSTVAGQTSPGSQRHKQKVELEPKRHSLAGGVNEINGEANSTGMEPDRPPIVEDAVA